MLTKSNLLVLVIIIRLLHVVRENSVIYRKIMRRSSATVISNIKRKRKKLKKKKISWNVVIWNRATSNEQLTVWRLRGEHSGPTRAHWRAIQSCFARADLHAL